MNVTTAPAALVAGVVIFAGGVNVGPLFVTITLNDPVAVKPALSVTMQSTCVVPRWNVDPDAGVQAAGIDPCSMSLPFAVNVTIAPAALVAGVVMSAGGVNVGPLFVTVTVNVVLVFALSESNAVQTTGKVPIGKFPPVT
jgi:hypothetical protein